MALQKLKTMMSILGSKKVFLVGTLCFGFLAVTFSLAQAQSTLTLSVTPTLFEMSANPGQVWQSQVKVINSNAFPLTIYPRVVNFAPRGEKGEGQFLPVFEHMTEGATLAEWIDISPEPITIPPEKSTSVPFFVNVPEDASPGGHFAAFLISTQPKDPGEGLAVKTSQIVTSLLFVRVEGDVREQGQVRTFTTADSFVPKPHVTFELRFENKGNVHLQPQGEILITNMWGKIRGRIPINERTHFGNVLPDSIRKFEFTWKGEQTIHDIGRYKAVASLAYGADSKQFVTSTTHFWVVPLRSLAITFGSLVLFVLLIVWSLRLYVRRVLQLAGVPIEERQKVSMHNVQDGDVAVGSYKKISAPVRSGVVDLRSRLANVSALIDKCSVVATFVWNYKKFFVGLAAFFIAVILLNLYISDVSKNQRDYEITINNPDTDLHLSAEEVAYEALAQKHNLPTFSDFMETSYELILINTSEEAGLAGSVAARLVKNKWYPSVISMSDGRQDEKTKIVFDISLQDEALQLSKLLDGALLSARPESEDVGSPNITIYIGEDQIKLESEKE